MEPHATESRVMIECRQRAREAFAKGRPVSRGAATVIVVIWVVLGVLGVIFAYTAFSPSPSR